MLTLYKFRNKAAHQGRAQIKDQATGAFRDLQASELGGFVFAVEALFEWIGKQHEVQFGPAKLPLRPNDQIIAILGDVTGEGGFELQTGESHGVREIQ